MPQALTTARSGDVLIVRHGPERGRLPNYLQGVLDEIIAARPALGRRLRYYNTGEPRPSLNGIASVVFWLGDPVRELYPACFADALPIAQDATQRGLRIINHPQALSNTIKSVQADLWLNAGLPAIAHKRFTDRSGMIAAVSQTHFPAILRADEQHAQIGTRLCATADEVLQVPAAEVHYPAALVEFVDVRPSHRRWLRRSSLFAQLFHKKRQFVFGSRTCNSHLFFSTNPLVASHTSTFLGVPPWPTDPIVRRQLDEAIALDVAYWERGSEAAATMRAAVDALGLDFAAIDYASRGDGSVVLFEANPYFHFPPMRDRMLPDERRTVERVAGYYAHIGDMLERLCDGER